MAFNYDDPHLWECNDCEYTQFGIPRWIEVKANEDAIRAFEEEWREHMEEAGHRPCGMTHSDDCGCMYNQSLIFW